MHPAKANTQQFLKRIPCRSQRNFRRRVSMRKWTDPETFCSRRTKKMESKVRI